MVNPTHELTLSEMMSGLRTVKRLSSEGEIFDCLKLIVNGRVDVPC